MHRSASRLTRVLACAAVPVILTVAGCSSDSGKDSAGKDGDKKSGSSASSKPGEKSKPELEKAAFATLPDPCKAIQTATIDTLVPEAKDKNGTATKSNDLASRASCSWNGLDEDGLKGSQYRWLSLSYFRNDSHASLGSANKRAEEQYKKQVETAKTSEGAQNVKAEEVGGIGDQGTSVVYTVKKDVDFFNTTIVRARRTWWSRSTTTVRPTRVRAPRTRRSCSRTRSRPPRRPSRRWRPRTSSRPSSRSSSRSRSRPSPSRRRGPGGASWGADIRSPVRCACRSSVKAR